MIYADSAKLLKVLAEPLRLKILDMLSCEEMCACEVLARLSITQPTLSHHMKSLVECSLVVMRKEQNRVYYTIDQDRVQDIITLITKILSPSEDCICKEIKEM